MSASVLYVRNLPPSARAELARVAKRDGVSEAEAARRVLAGWAAVEKAGRSRKGR